MAKRGTLSDFTAEKPSRVASAQAEAPDQARRGQTLRLTPEAWRQLKILAVEQGVASHTLLIEAVNDLFRKHDKPPIA